MNVDLLKNTAISALRKIPDNPFWMELVQRSPHIPSGIMTGKDLIYHITQHESTAAILKTAMTVQAALDPPGLRIQIARYVLEERYGEVLQRDAETERSYSGYITPLRSPDTLVKNLLQLEETGLTPSASSTTDTIR